MRRISPSRLILHRVCRGGLGREYGGGDQRGSVGIRPTTVPRPDSRHWGRGHAGSRSAAEPVRPAVTNIITRFDLVPFKVGAPTTIIVIGTLAATPAYLKRPNCSWVDWMPGIGSACL